MSELENPSSNAGVKITEISLRYAEQVVELENIDPEEIFSESNLRLAFTVEGIKNIKYTVWYDNTWKPFAGKNETETTEITNSGVGGRFGADIKLHNGINKFNLRVVDAEGSVLAESQFELQHKGSFREWNETIFIAFFLAIIIRSLVVQAFWIPTGSMEPTLYGESKNPVTNRVERSGDRILVSRFAYTFDLSLDGRLPFAQRYWVKKPKRGDIVVFRFPDPEKTNPPKDYIKRVIGLPGDKVEIKWDGTVYINDQPLYEPYTKEPANKDFGPITVPQDSLFVLGDNRNNSADSRYWGFMPLTNLKGQAIFNYLPINRFSPIRSYDHDKLSEKAKDVNN